MKEELDPGRLSRALDVACDYIKDVHGSPPMNLNSWREWWLKLVDEDQDKITKEK